MTVRDQPELGLAGAADDRAEPGDCGGEERRLRADAARNRAAIVWPGTCSPSTAWKRRLRRSPPGPVSASAWRRFVALALDSFSARDVRSRSTPALSDPPSTAQMTRAMIRLARDRGCGERA
jgi:hypothetical protein